MVDSGLWMVPVSVAFIGTPGTDRRGSKILDLLLLPHPRSFIIDLRHPLSLSNPRKLTACFSSVDDMSYN